MTYCFKSGPGRTESLYFPCLSLTLLSSLLYVILPCYSTVTCACTCCSELIRLWGLSAKYKQICCSRTTCWMGMATKNNITIWLSPYLLVIIELFMYRTGQTLYQREREREREWEREREGGGAAIIWSSAVVHLNQVCRRFHEIALLIYWMDDCGLLLH